MDIEPVVSAASVSAGNMAAFALPYVVAVVIAWVAVRTAAEIIREFFGDGGSGMSGRGDRHHSESWNDRQREP